jgi:CRISPR-associated protein Cmr2
MLQYLFSISIGPVQDFIAAARRTRDLFFGSALLSELSKAGALAAAQYPGAELIFPASTDVAQLQPNSSFSVANKLLFLLPTDDPTQVSEQIQQAIQTRWLAIANTVLNEVQEAIHLDLWADQVADAIEYYAAWVSCPNDEAYALARTQVERLLAGRKALRNFLPAQGHNIPKSSLDGSRESVLRKGAKLKIDTAFKARLKDNEQLDAIGLVKRLGEIGGRREYPSISRIAADSWVRGLPDTAESALNDFKKTCSDSQKGSIAKLQGSQFEKFPFEGGVLYEQRLLNDLADVPSAEELYQQLKALYRSVQSQPSPYVAILLADGDKMGETLSALNTVKEHQQLSQQLSSFADQAVPNIVSQHQGLLVYSGGDDVLAFLPVDTCLAAAKALHTAFSKELGAVLPSHLKAPTLSVGIVIAHCMEPMGDLLAWARLAEKKAKDPDRNGLAIWLQTRSGGEPIILREQWHDMGLDHRLPQWANLHLAEALSDKSAYDFRQLANFYQGWKDFPAEAAQEDAKRLLKRKRTRTHQEWDAQTTQLIKSRFTSAEAIHTTAHELILARHLATAYQLAGYTLPSAQSESPVSEAT